MNNLAKLLAVAFAALLLSACSGQATKPGEGGPAVEDHSTGTTAPGTEGAQGGAGASTNALPGQAGVQGDELNNPNSPLAKRTIYFDFDKSDVKDEFKPIIAAHAHYLATHPNAHVVLEGNTDERGSREYNIGLGERRAEAVRRLMLFQGATDQQIQVVSYGEERPVALGHDEAAWAQNRRVDIVYKR